MANESRENGSCMMKFEALLQQTCVFEVDAVDVDRFFVGMLAMETPPRLILIDQPEEYRKYLATGKFAQAQVVCTAWNSVKALTKLLRDNEIRYLLIDAHRIPDVHIVLAARDAGCKVLYIQHGMYIPFMKRTLEFFLTKLLKTVRYLYYAFDCGRHVGDWRLAVDLFRIHVLGAKRDLVRARREIFPDSAAAFSAYWRQWHVDHYAFPSDVLHEMGTPDLRKLHFGARCDARTVAYCYQTLVEDGRIAPEAMQAFYRQLKAWSEARGLRVLVKTHPRGNTSLFDQMKNEFGFELVSSEIPNTDMVIGHYSSLLAFWGVHGRQVVCVTLPGHAIHESIAPWATVVSSLDGVEPGAVPASDPAKCQAFFGQVVPIDQVRATLYAV